MTLSEQELYKLAKEMIYQAKVVDALAEHKTIIITYDSTKHNPYDNIKRDSQ